MRCSECSKVVRPIVAVDIDGTLGAYHSHFLEFAHQYLGSEPPLLMDEYDGDMSFRHWFTTSFNVDDAEWHTIKLAYRQGGMKRSMPTIESQVYTSQFVAQLRQSLGCEVWITTTRPFLRLDGIDPDTREWLHRNRIGYDGLLYDEDKYAVLARNVDPKRVVAVLDDLPEQFDAAGIAFGATIPILRRTQYNRAVDRPLTAKTLDRALEVISARVATWKEQHGES